MILGAVIFVFLLFFQMNGLLLQRSRAQTQADALALSCAAGMNQGDRIAQVNDLKACSRELVFLSRQREQLCDAPEYRLLQPLCSELVIESRAGAGFVEAERKNQIRLVCSEIQSRAWQHNRKVEREDGFALGWLKASDPTITRIEVGRIENVESNVRHWAGASELALLDAENGYVDAASNLLKANRNARLPGNDADLDFHITSLPALVKGTRAPARNVSPKKFISDAVMFDQGVPTKAAIPQIPTAIRITSTMKASLGDKAEHQGTVHFISTAATTGAIAGNGRP